MDGENSDSRVVMLSYLFVLLLHIYRNNRTWKPTQWIEESQPHVHMKASHLAPSFLVHDGDLSSLLCRKSVDRNTDTAKEVGVGYRGSD